MMKKMKQVTVAEYFALQDDPYIRGFLDPNGDVTIAGVDKHGDKYGGDKYGVVWDEERCEGEERLRNHGMSLMRGDEIVFAELNTED